MEKNFDLHCLTVITKIAMEWQATKYFQIDDGIFK